MKLTHAQCFSILQLDSHKEYSPSDIRQAYLHRAKAVHPDKCQNYPKATHDFQFVSCAYETLITYHKQRCRCTGANCTSSDIGITGDTASETESDAGTDPWMDSGTDSGTDMDVDIDVQMYKEMFERLSERASTFWETSPEAHFVKSIWKTWKIARGCPSKDNTSRTPNTYTSDMNGLSSPEPPTEFPKAPTPTPNPSETTTLESAPSSSVPPSSSPSSSAPIHITLSLPLIDVYNNTVHKVNFKRYRYTSRENNQEGDRTIEDTSVLIPAACTRIVFYGEGDQETEHSEPGDVVFEVIPEMPSKEYRIHPTRKVLQRVVKITPHEMCYGTVCNKESIPSKTVDVCGCTVHVPIRPRLYERWNHDDGKKHDDPNQSNGIRIGCLKDRTNKATQGPFNMGHVITIPYKGLVDVEDLNAHATENVNDSTGTDMDIHRGPLELVCVVIEP